MSLKTRLGFSQLQQANQQANSFSHISQQLNKSQKALSNLELTSEEPKLPTHSQEESVSVISSAIASPKQKDGA